MGNNASTQAGGSRGSSRQPSPRSRAIPLSSASSPAPTPERERPARGAGGRKKSIDMPDVVPSRSRTSTASSGGGSVRRKGSDRPPVVDEEADTEAETPGGSLRGALQGKAEHVVYGPRRDDDTQVLLGPPTLPRASAAPRDKAVAAMAIPGAGAGGSSKAVRTPAGGAAGGRDGSLTNAGMGAIGASAMPMDPDDTTHPGFSTAPRLTSAVLMSTDRMPIVSSPKTEGMPDGSPFRTGSAASVTSAPLPPPAVGGEGDGSLTPTQEQPGLSLGDSSKVPSGDLAATLSAPGAGSAADLALPPGGVRTVITPQTSFAGAASAIFAPSDASSSAASAYPSTSAAVFAPVASTNPAVPTSSLLPPHTSSPFPPSNAPSDTVHAPPVPSSALPLAADRIPSGTSVIASPSASRGGTPTVPSPAVLLPPAVFNAPVAAIPIPLLSVPSQTIAQNLLAAAVDLGAGPDGVPTLIKWKNEDGQVPAAQSKDGKARGPKEVFVTGTFAKGWKTKIELRKTDPSDFSALISLPPGPHRLKFIVDNEWKASKHLPVATDADGNLINYLQVTSAAAAAPSAQPQPGTTPRTAAAQAAAGGAQYLTPGSGGVQAANGLFWPFGIPGVGPNGAAEEDDPAASGAGGEAWEENGASWSQEIPPELVAWGEWETQRDQIENDFYTRYPNGPSADVPYPELPPPPPSAGVPPPSLPAQLEKGPLNHAAYVTQGSGDDNSILPKPDHSVINHLAASPIKGGFLSVGVTTRYRRKFVTIVYYKALSTR
ncbi:hypothetical protein JCM10213_003740 [Rhodosporidiobolus nylandii]